MLSLGCQLHQNLKHDKALNLTLTSNGYFWTFPGKKLLKNSICVLPEKTDYKEINCAGICSDFIEKYKND